MIKKDKDSEPAMGFDTKKMLQAFIGTLKDTSKNSSLEDTPSPFVSTELGEDMLEKNDQKINTDKKIRDLWENLKQQMIKYDAKQPVAKKKTAPPSPNDLKQ
ncbi:MAG: hypothetical protein HUU50_18735 [Candidatus Brocadiae bacterium]|nr:hypothetical protein [Candidatus Brocadiia bacterium]